MKALTVLLTASGVPGSAALIRALRENGERELRLIGTDMSERSVESSLRTIRATLGLRSRAQLAAWSIENLGEIAPGHGR